MEQKSLNCKQLQPRPPRWWAACGRTEKNRVRHTELIEVRFAGGKTMLSSLLLLVALAGAQQPARVAVYISAPMRDGFVDTNRDIQDSIKDVRSRLSRMKEFQLVDSREKADIIVTMVTRGVGSEAYGQRLSYTEYYNNAVLTSTPVVANTYWVAAVMEAGTYRKEFMGAYTHQYAYSMGAWGECAKQLANDLKSWTVANREQIRQRGSVR